MKNLNIKYKIKIKMANQSDQQGQRKQSEKIEIEDSFIIKADFIRETKDSFYLDCEGDPTWFPKSKINFDADKQELECPRWLLKEKFPNENF